MSTMIWYNETNLSAVHPCRILSTVLAKFHTSFCRPDSIPLVGWQGSIVRVHSPFLRMKGEISRAETVVGYQRKKDESWAPGLAGLNVLDARINLS